MADFEWMRFERESIMSKSRDCSG